MHDKSLFQVIFELTCEGYKVNFYSTGRHGRELTMQVAKGCLIETYKINFYIDRDYKEWLMSDEQEEYVKKILLSMVNLIKETLGEKPYEVNMLKGGIKI